MILKKQAVRKTGSRSLLGDSDFVRRALEGASPIRDGTVAGDDVLNRRAPAQCYCTTMMLEFEWKLKRSSISGTSRSSSAMAMM